MSVILDYLEELFKDNELVEKNQKTFTLLVSTRRIRKFKSR